MPSHTKVEQDKRRKRTPFSVFRGAEILKGRAEQLMEQERKASGQSKKKRNK